MLIVSDSDRVALESLIQEYHGELTYYKTPEETQKGNSILEFTWNHTTLHARSCNPKITYLQAFQMPFQQESLLPISYFHLLRHRMGTASQERCMRSQVKRQLMSNQPQQPRRPHL